MNFSLQLTEDAVMHKYAIVFLDSGLGLRAGKFHARIFSSSSSLLHASRTSAFVFFCLFVRSFVCMCCMFAVRQSTLVRGENPQLFRFRFAVVTCGAACRVKFHCSIVVSDIKKNVRWPVAAMLFFFQICTFTGRRAATLWSVACRHLLICAFSDESVRCSYTVRLVHKLLC